MKKIIKWWNKLKGWQIGSIIGLCVSIILILLNSFLFYGHLGIIFYYPINWFLFDFLNLWGLRNCGESCWWIAILIGNVEFIILSIVIGLLIGYIIKKRE